LDDAETARVSAASNRMSMGRTSEQLRLNEDRARLKYWRRWGPYLSERAWGSVREDYSPGGTAWDYFPHDHARSRAYRWNEGGLAGISDRHQRVCFAIALWNGRDPILKERLFGLTGSEGNHGEDVKEYYFYIDSTPTHSYMKFLYKYPQAAFPYTDLVDENRRRGRGAPEYELADTGVFDEDRYFDVEVEYAKADAEDILIRIHVTNRGPEAATIDVLPTVWFRNVWSWHHNPARPSLAGTGCSTIALDDPKYGRRYLHVDGARLKPSHSFESTQPSRSVEVARVALHGKRDKRTANLRRAERSPIRKGCISSFHRERRTRCRESRRRRNQGCRAIFARAAAAAVVDAAAPADARACSEVR
jgi:hypothetical protein